MPRRKKNELSYIIENKIKSIRRDKELMWLDGKIDELETLNFILNNYKYIDKSGKVRYMLDGEYVNALIEAAYIHSLALEAFVSYSESYSEDTKQMLSYFTQLINFNKIDALKLLKGSFPAWDEREKPKKP